MVFERTKRIVDGKLRKLGIKVKYKIWREKYEESWVYERGHVVHLNPNDRKSHSLAIETMEHLLLHEIAHIMFTDYVTMKVRKGEEARKLFGDLTKTYRRSLQRKRDSKDYISTYAQVHPEDNFAEVFAFFVNFEGDLKRIRKILNRIGKNNRVLKQMFWVRDFLESVAAKQKTSKYRKIVHRRRHG
jgi:hypothetical protein